MLDGNSIAAEAMAKLASAPMPSLASLWLAHNQMDAAAVEQLVTGVWPELVYLDLNDNFLDDVALGHLAEGDWPLEVLIIGCNGHVTAEGIQFLTEGDCNWDLNTLHLDKSLINAATWGYLNLDADHLHSAGLSAQLQAQDCGLRVPRLLQWVPPVQHAAWLQLKHVNFTAHSPVQRQVGNKTIMKMHHYSSADAF